MVGNQWFIVAFGIFMFLGSISAQEQAQAKFNMLGVTGSVTFIANGEATQAIIDLALPKEYTWEIRAFPVIVAQKHPCNDSIVGETLHDITASVSTIDNSTAENRTVILDDISLLIGETAIMGRTLLLISDEERVCAPILAIEHQVSYAVVNGHVAGQVHVHKIGEKYAFLTDLFSTQTLEDKNYTINIYRGSVTPDLPNYETFPSYVERCDRVTGQTLLAEMNATVAGAGKHIRFMTYVTPNDLSFDFSGGSLHIKTDTGTSCANFHTFERKSVRAIFSADGLAGTIAFSQNNPYEPTTISVDLQGLNKAAGGYHVHEFPIGYKYASVSDVCGGSITGAHFSPLPVASGPTQDYAEIGDLSTKHGSLAGLEEISQSYEDLYLPLFGEYSIIGRSIVIHAKDGSRWVCANIGYPGPVVSAIARFDFFAEGTITFTQERDKPWTDTTVFVRMAVAGFNQDETKNHKYHIHTDPVAADGGSKDSPCSSTGGHWNPYDVNIQDANVYSAACSGAKLGCEAGDLNGKFGTIDLAGQNSYKNYFYTDDIALSGAYGVIGKSITIHVQEEGGNRYACADISEKLQVRASAPDYASSGGFVKIEESEISGVTNLKVEFVDLDVKAAVYHVHQVPLDASSPGDNICVTTGGHFNPYGATSWTEGDTLDRYEVGDLSSKFGSLNEQATYSLSTTDTNLPLSGYNSIVGRSVVIHDTSGSRWKCFDVEYDAAAMEGTLIQAIVTFNGVVDGRIILSQIATDYGSSDVTVDIKLSYKDGRAATENHNWHVHVDVYDGESCSSTGGHYNPFNVDVGQDEFYPKLCGPANPQKCEMGDQSGKLGKVKVGDDYREVYTDSFLTLVGDYSVMGRSIVIHAADSGGERLDCGDIVPFGNSSKSVEFLIQKQAGSSYRSDMAAIIADQIKATPSSVYVAETSKQQGGCAPVRVYFTGPNSMEMLGKFEPQFLGEYAKVEKCDTTASDSGTTQAALLSLWLSLLSVAASLVLPRH